MFFLNFDLGCDLGKEFMQRLDRSDCALQGSLLTMSGDVLRRILETYSIGSALRTQQFHPGGRKVGAKAG